MAISRTASVSILSATTIASANTNTGAVVDVLGDDTSAGDAWIFVTIVSTVTAGSIDFRFNAQDTNAATYQKTAFEISIPPTNGTQNIPLGKRPIARYMSVDVKNNATGANATVTVKFNLEKIS